MAIKKEGAVSSPKKEETVLSVWELLNKTWSLEYEVNCINSNYKTFHKDMTWSRYGEVLMLKQHIPALIENLQKLSEKIEKGDRE